MIHTDYPAATRDNQVELLLGHLNRRVRTPLGTGILIAVRWSQAIVEFDGLIDFFHVASVEIPDTEDIDYA